MLRIQLFVLMFSSLLLPALAEAGSSHAQDASIAYPVELEWVADGGSDVFDYAQDVTVAPDGNLWVADLANRQFQIFAPDGTYLESWGTEGVGPGLFSFFQGPVAVESDWAGNVKFDSAGNIYVLDLGSQNIQKFAPDRTFLLAWGVDGMDDGQFKLPINMAIDAADHVYVSDYGRDDIQEFTSDGTYVRTVVQKGTGEGPISGLVAVAIDAAGNIWTTDEDHYTVLEYAPDGTFLMSFGEFGSGPGQFDFPNDLAVAADGTIYVVDTFNHRVQAFDRDGTYLGEWGGEGTEPGQFMFPLGVEVDDAGNIYVVDSGNDRLQKFRRTSLPAATPSA
jgi:tripartite motif-containing protein 71